jgi:hypothetical protein
LLSCVIAGRGIKKRTSVAKNKRPQIGDPRSDMRASLKEEIEWYARKPDQGMISCGESPGAPL